MRPWLDSCGAFDAALDRMKRAPRDDPDAQRRALNDAMACLYRLRNYRLRRCGDAYWRLAEASQPGQLVEAIVLLRGAGGHDFSRDVAPRDGLAYSAGRTYPGGNLRPDRHNLFWRSRSDLDHDLPAHDEPRGARNARHYDEFLANVLVLDTLTLARPFLLGEVPAPSRAGDARRPAFSDLPAADLPAADLSAADLPAAGRVRAARAQDDPAPSLVRVPVPVLALAPGGGDRPGRARAPHPVAAQVRRFGVPASVCRHVVRAVEHRPAGPQRRTRRDRLRGNHRDR